MQSSLLKCCKVAVLASLKMIGSLSKFLLAQHCGSPAQLKNPPAWVRILDWKKNFNIEKSWSQKAKSWNFFESNFDPKLIGISNLVFFPGLLENLSHGLGMKWSQIKILTSSNWIQASKPWVWILLEAYLSPNFKVIFYVRWCWHSSCLACLASLTAKFESHHQKKETANEKIQVLKSSQVCTLTENNIRKRLLPLLRTYWECISCWILEDGSQLIEPWSSKSLSSELKPTMANDTNIYDSTWPS